MKRQTGYIKAVMTKRNSGFIWTEDGQEYFFHRAGFVGDFEELREGHKVEFSVMPCDKHEAGVKAVAVELVGVNRPSHEAVKS